MGCSIDSLLDRETPRHCSPVLVSFRDPFHFAFQILPFYSSTAVPGAPDAEAVGYTTKLDKPLGADMGAPGRATSVVGSETGRVTAPIPEAIEGADAGEKAEIALSYGFAGEVATESELHALDNFFKKYNKVSSALNGNLCAVALRASLGSGAADMQVLSHKLVLEKEREEIKDQNSELQRALKEYLQGISVAEDTVEGANTLLVVNGRTTVSLPVMAAGGQVVQDANHLVATRRALK